MSVGLPSGDYNTINRGDLNQAKKNAIQGILNGYGQADNLPEGAKGLELSFLFLQNMLKKDIKIVHTIQKTV